MNSSVDDVGDEERQEHEDVGEALVDRLSFNPQMSTTLELVYSSICGRRRNGIKKVKVEELTVHPPVACWGGGCVAEAGVQQQGEQEVSQHGQSRRHRSHGFTSIDRFTDHSH
jgi:hypothetical protein